jgi:hypothetical protein
VTWVGERHVALLNLFPSVIVVTQLFPKRFEYFGDNKGGRTVGKTNWVREVNGLKSLHVFVFQGPRIRNFDMISDEKRRLRYTPKESVKLEEVLGYVVSFIGYVRLWIPALTSTLPLSIFILWHRRPF